MMGATKAFEVARQYKNYQPNSDEAFALVTLANGKTFRHEFYYGSTYLSQSSRTLRYSGSVVRIEVYNFRGERKEITL
jgi:enediyne biosynthesis protein E4